MRCHFGGIGAKHRSTFGCMEVDLYSLIGSNFVLEEMFWSDCFCSRPKCIFSFHLMFEVLRFERASIDFWKCLSEYTMD